MEKILLLVLAATLFVGCGDPSSQGFTGLDSDSIINGKPVGARESAAAKSVVMVEMLNNDNQRLGFCTGTLIEANIVLTAAHCFDLRIFPKLRKFNILFVNSLAERSAAVVRKGVAYTMNSDYNSAGQVDHDIAVALFQYAAPTGFAPVKMDEDVTANYGSKILYVYGYGRTLDYHGRKDRPEARSMGVLHRGLMMVESDYYRYEDRYYTRMDSGSTICQGDSGGPQFYNEGKVLKVVGVNSAVFGDKLPNGQSSCRAQGQATKVARFAPWIKKEIKAMKKKYWYGVNAEPEVVQ